MPITIRQVGPCFAGEVDGIDMRTPLTRDEVAAIHAGMDQYAVLVFHDQKIDDAQQLAFTRSLGDDRARHRHQPARRQTRPACPRPSPTSPTSTRTTSRTPRDDRRRLFAIGNRLWHSDSSFKVVPAKYSLLHARQHPVQGRQHRVRRHARGLRRARRRDQGRGRGAWSASTRRCSRASIIGFTDFTDEERERFKPVRQCLVRTHPVTGRKSLYLSSHAGGIVGWPMPEARGFLRDLIEHATQREFVYTHKWRVGDLVMWDNRQTMHRARPFPAHEPRDMRRTTLAGDGPTAVQAAA